MSSAMVIKTCVFVFTLFSSLYGGLRTQTTVACKSRQTQLHCQLRCNMKPALCVDSTCYCMSIAPAKETLSELKNASVENGILRRKNIIQEYVDKKDFKREEVPRIELEALYASRPTVRHHIAHFCPNLDVARKCIRKCMAEGKPAFCGKDHVCYCGHKYTHTGKDEGGNAKEIYGQFKDLYKKYFGPNYGQDSIQV